MKTINKILRLSTNKLKQMKITSKTLQDDVLKMKIEESKLDDNNTHVNYLSNLLIIEHQQQMHKFMKYFTKKKS